VKKLPDILVAAFTKTMDDVSVDSNLRADYTKWLRFYLDLCFKYRHPPRDADSVTPFLQKRASKHQSETQQKEAASSIMLYYQTMKNWSVIHPESATKAEDASPNSLCDSVPGRR
jgi:hypothetical protein